MNVQHLRYALAIARNDMSVTRAAQELGLTQPALSRGLKALESEIGFPVFARSGRGFSGPTAEGRRVLEQAARAVREIDSLGSLAADLAGESSGSLSIATTHTQARYVLPPVIREFSERWPDVALNLHQGTSEQIAEMVEDERVQLAIATGSEGLFPELVLLPVYRWHRQVLVPKRHPLTRLPRLSLRALAEWPLVTYVFSFSGPSSLHQLFAREGLTPRVALTARDSDVIKTYVRLGLGVGIVASVAVEPEDARDLVLIDASHLFPIHTTWVGFRRGARLREHARDFLHMFGAHLTPKLVERAQSAADAAAVNELFRKISLPVR